MFSSFSCLCIGVIACIFWGSFSHGISNIKLYFVFVGTLLRKEINKGFNTFCSLRKIVILYFDKGYLIFNVCIRNCLIR